jgi:hypothetical protein
MKTATKKLAIALLALCAAAYAQTKYNTEAELFAKEKAMRDECAKIAKIVPCAVEASSEIKNSWSAALDQSKRKARYEIAQVVKVFVSYAAKDTSFIENGVAQELSQIIGKVSIDSIALINSAVLDQAYGVVTNDITGEKSWRAITLMVLNPQLYEEAQKEIIPLTEPQPPTPTPTAQSSASAKQTAQQTPTADQQKADYKKAAKRIATKAVKIIITTALRFIGL